MLQKRKKINNALITLMFLALLIIGTYFISNRYKDAKLASDGKLADLAPTMLEVLGIEKPHNMNGVSLLKK